MKKLYSARSEAELAVLRSILDAEDIPHFVHNEAFGSIIVGPSIDQYNAKSIMVPDELEDRAREVISRFELDHRTDDTEATTLRDRLRMILEFGRFVPGRSNKRTRPD